MGQVVKVYQKNEPNLANLSMTNIAGMNLHEEWMERSEWWYVNKNNTNLANLRMMSIVGMYLHMEWMERNKWWNVIQNIKPISLT